MRVCSFPSPSHPISGPPERSWWRSGPRPPARLQRSPNHRHAAGGERSILIVLSFVFKRIVRNFYSESVMQICTCNSLFSIHMVRKYVCCLLFNEYDAPPSLPPSPALPSPLSGPPPTWWQGGRCRGVQRGGRRLRHGGQAGGTGSPVNYRTVGSGCVWKVGVICSSGSGVAIRLSHCGRKASQVNCCAAGRICHSLVVFWSCRGVQCSRQRGAACWLACLSLAVTAYASGLECISYPIENRYAFGRMGCIVRRRGMEELSCHLSCSIKSLRGAGWPEAQLHCHAATLKQSQRVNTLKQSVL